MSSQALVWALNAHDVSIYEKAVLIYLADHADAVGMVRKTSVGDMAKRCRCSRTSIYRAIRALVERGRITDYGQQFILHLEVLV